MVDFRRGVELADFAAFPLLLSAGGRAELAEYFRDHLRIGAQAGTSVVFETPTWRANADWAPRLGYDADILDGVNRDAVSFLRVLGEEFPTVELIVSGLIGPRGDGYNPRELLTPNDAAIYHQVQIDSFVAAGADRVTMLTATHTSVVIAFTVETDGRLPTGQALHQAIAEVDDATEGAPPHLQVLGGCCGTDARHVEAIAYACIPPH